MNWNIPAGFVQKCLKKCIKCDVCNINLQTLVGFDWLCIGESYHLPLCVSVCVMQRVVQVTCASVVTVTVRPVELLKLQETATLRRHRRPSVTWRLAGLATGCCPEMQTNTRRPRAPDRSTRSSSRLRPRHCRWWSLQVRFCCWIPKIAFKVLHKNLVALYTLIRWLMVSLWFSF